MQHTGCQCQPLFPAAGQRAGQLVLPGLQAQLLQSLLYPLPALRHAIDPGNKIEVFPQAQIIIQPETLCHITNVSLDIGSLPDDVIAQRMAGTAIGCQQAAHHADRGGFAAAIRAEKAINLAASYLHGQVIHHQFVVKTLVQSFDINDPVVTVHD